MVINICLTQRTYRHYSKQRVVIVSAVIRATGSQVYAGPSAFSEIETQSVANFLKENKANIKAYFNLHAKSQMWLYPFSYARATYPADIDDIVRGVISKSLRGLLL